MSLDGKHPKKVVYIKQQLVDNMKNGKSKVLINPNFVSKVHVNPHFNKQFLQNHTIHVNPNVLRQSDTRKSVPIPTKTIVSTPTKLVKVPEKANVQHVIVSTRTKFVRMPKGVQSGSIVTNTKYKKVNQSASPKKVNIKRLFYGRSRFKVDNRNVITKTRLIHNKSHKTTLTTKNVYLKQNSKLNKTHYVSINGILYKRSLKSLVAINKKKTSQQNVCKLLTIRGQKYKLDSNHRTLTLLSCNGEKTKPSFKTIYLGGITFKQKEPNVFIKTTQKHVLLSQAKQRSIHTLTNKMRKSNVSCPFFRKFGKCRGKENGTCIRIHNPEQISLCPKFLQGACVINNCLLSHRVSAEKMPTCKYFLEGLCSKDDCPYLHIKISSKAEICRDFLEGFCKKAAECEKRHQYLCPEFENNQSCKKRRCPYPHGIGSRVRNVNVFYKKLEISTTNYKNVLNKESNDQNECHNMNRYYEESKTDTENSKTEQQNSNIQLIDRPKLGDLPSFIPFLNENS